MPKFIRQQIVPPQPLVIGAAATAAPQSYIYTVPNGTSYTTTTNYPVGGQQLIAYHPAYSSGVVPAGRPMS